MSLAGDMDSRYIQYRNMGFGRGHEQWARNVSDHAITVTLPGVPPSNVHIESIPPRTEIHWIHDGYRWSEKSRTTNLR